MLHEIKVKNKHLSLQKKIQEIINEVDKATSYYLCLSKTHQLKKIDFANTSVDTNRIIGAVNAIKKREEGAQ